VTEDEETIDEAKDTLEIDDEALAGMSVAFLNHLVHQLELKRSPASVKRDAALAIRQMGWEISRQKHRIWVLKEQNLALGKANRDMNR